MPETRATVFTIGHSTRSMDEFLGLLQASRIQCVVDVRRLPGSRAFPHFNADLLAASLVRVGIDYWHATALGGRRRAAEAEDAGNGFWTNPSFRHYAGYATTSAFREGIAALQARAGAQRCALMCSEAVWWRCHRRIIADHLIARGHPVRHIMGPGKVVDATLTEGAVAVAGDVVYPPPETTQAAAIPESRTP